MILSLNLIIVAVTVFVSWRAFENSALFEKLLNNPYQVKHRKQYYRILSHVLVHADGIHLGLNMFVLYSFGRAVEVRFMDDYGATRGPLFYLLLYVFGAIAATLPSLRKHGDNYGYNSVGASGAVSAVMMAAMILHPVHKIELFFILPMPSYMAIAVFFVIEHLMNRSGKTNIAHDAHIWGALFGLLFIAVLDPGYYEDAYEWIRRYPGGLPEVPIEN